MKRINSYLIYTDIFNHGNQNLLTLRESGQNMLLKDKKLLHKIEDLR